MSFPLRPKGDTERQRLQFPPRTNRTPGPRPNGAGGGRMAGWVPRAGVIAAVAVRVQ